MRHYICCGAATCMALMAGTLLAELSPAQAQTVITSETAVDGMITQPPRSLIVAQEPVIMPPPGVLVTQPVQTVQTVPVQTVETVQTVQPADTHRQRAVSRHVERTRSGDRITTTRTTVREDMAAAPATSTQVVQAPVVMPPYQGLYNVAPAPLPPGATVVTQPMVGTAVIAPPVYRYVYEPDRILVIDANTGIAVQAIAR